MKKNIFIPILGLFLINTANCTNGLQNNKYGAISTSVKFPERKFSLKVIPDATSLILVQVVGVGIDEKNPLTINLSRDNSKHILDQVPQGEKIVKAIAIDTDGNVLATGQASVNVIAQSLTKAEINLNLIKISNNIQKDCIVDLSFSDLPLSKTLEKSITDAGCTIKVPKSPPNAQPSPTQTTDTSVISSTPPIESANPIPSPTATASIYRDFGNSGSGGSNVAPTNPTSSPVNINVTYASPTPFPSTTVQ